jgi:hypothetical protein
MRCRLAGRVDSIINSHHSEELELLLDKGKTKGIGTLNTCSFFCRSSCAPAQHVGFLPKDWQDTGIGFKALNRFASPARDNPDALCIASASSEDR